MKLPMTFLGLAVLLVTACGPKDDTADVTASGPTAEPAASAPAGSTTGEPNAIDFNNYPLDMDKMKKWVTTTKLFRDAAKTDGAVENLSVVKLDRSTSEWIAGLEGNAATRDALQKAGWSAKDYVWTTTAWLQNAMVEESVSTVPGATYPAGTNRKNIDFVKANKKEIGEMVKAAGVMP